jgi:hypothetical protein
MRYNGLCAVIERAIDEAGAPLLSQYRQAIVLGAIREDYWRLPIIGKIIEQPSLTHFYGPGLPGGFFPFITFSARTRARRCFSKAISELAAGRKASAFVQLGRAAHLLIDMGCPVHVHRVAHETDPYEWYVEGNRAQLEALPLPPIPPVYSVFKLVEQLAQFTAHFRADATNSVHGRIFRRLGIRNRLTKDEVAEQARQIIPMTTSYAIALFRHFAAESGIEQRPIDAAA